MSAPLSIGFDAVRAFSNRRGLGNYSREVLRQLGMHCPEVRCTLFTPRLGVEFALPPGAEVVMPQGVMRYARRLWRGAMQGLEVSRRALDVYHGLSNYMPTDVRRTGVGTVVTVHDLNYLKNPKAYPLIDRLSYAHRYIRSAHEADRCIAISHAVKQDLIELAGVDEARIDVVYQCCNPIFSRPIDAEQLKEVGTRHNLPRDFALMVGAIEPNKNHALVFRALHLMRSRGHDVPLVVVGHHSRYADGLKALAVELGIDGCVTMLHDVATDDLPALYRLATVFICPSFAEGFGISIVEAQTAGTPVIATDDRVLRATGGDAARYVDPHNAEQLAEEMEELLGSEQTRAEIVTKARQHATQFSGEAMARGLMETYRRVLR